MLGFYSSSSFNPHNSESGMIYYLANCRNLSRVTQLVNGEGHQGLSYPQAYVLLSPQSNQHLTFFPTASLQCVETACLGYLGLILVDGKGTEDKDLNIFRR